MLPTSVDMPVAVFTIPRATSPSLESSIAGNAALYTEAVRLIAARNRIRSRIPRLCFKYTRPLFAALSTDSCFSLPLSSAPALGILIKNKRDINATAKVNKSKAITA